MSDFFKSEMVRGDIQEMMELQQICFKYAMSFPILEKERKEEYLAALLLLLEKQEIMYARMKLSDDPEAESVIENMAKGAVMLGGDQKLSVSDLFADLKRKVGAMKETLERG